jgi:CheY-like chemotaxis protein/CRP-like cAMP-binding protein
MSQTILVIDDNTDLRENTAEILELAGYRTITAANGKEGVERAIREKPSLVICDIMMPELDGYGVLHLLRKHPDTATVPFIFLTARTERGDFRKGMDMGADDYLTKPFDDIELLNAVEVRLKKAAALTQGYAATPQGLSDFIRGVKSSGGLPGLTGKYDTESYGKKQALYHEGKRPRFLFYLVSGKVKCFRTNEDGKEYITDLFSAGDFIGYAPLLEDKLYEDTAIVLEDAEILQVPRDEFLAMVHSDIAIAAKFIHIMTKDRSVKEERLLNLAYSSLRRRVAKALVDIHEKFYAGSTGSTLQFSRDDIAQYVGTATESLIRMLSDFKNEKLIDIKSGKISITDLEKLKHLPY